MKRRLLGSLQRRESIYGYLFIAPHVLGFSVFTLGALAYSLYLGFTSWDLFGSPRWVGVANFTQLLTSDDVLWKALWNTVYYTVITIPLALVLALVLALALNTGLKGLTAFRTVFFMPVVTSTVAVALVWSWIYNKDFGLLNAFLGVFHVSPQNWLGSTKWAMLSIIIMSVWKGLGYNMVLFLAGLQGIPRQLYEAARIDGAGWWNQFRYVTLPLLTPTTFFLIIMGIIGSFQVFDQAYIITNGGPDYATTTIVMLIYRNAFQWFHMGYASALAWVLFMMILAVSLIQIRLSRRWVYYEYGN